MIRAISYGGGVQSTALLVLAAQGEIDYRLALFANVGNDSENPATVRYVEQVAKPYAERHGIELVEVQRIKRDGSPDTVMRRIHEAKRSIVVPVRLSMGAPGNRTCTVDFKIKPVAKELKRRGATKENPAMLALGISMDEMTRMRTAQTPHEIHDYPLVFQARMTRQDCINVIERAGLPVPPKSSCWFCPFHSRAEWRRMARHDPDMFEKCVELERLMNDRRAELGKDKVWFSSALRPLDEAFSDDGQLSMFTGEEATCDIGGYCFV